MAVLLAAGGGIVVSAKIRQQARADQLIAAAQAREAAARALAAQWVVQGISRGTAVACDAAMCRALLAHGFAQADLRMLGKASPYPLSASVVIETAFVHNLFGTSLASYYAPEIIASFGSGAGRIEVREVASQGAPAFTAANGQDLQLRKSVGRQLLNSRQINLTATAMKQLLAGQPDARLLIVIELLASDYHIDIVGFGNYAEGESNGIPLRYVDLGETDQADHLASSKYVQAMITTLRTQAGAFAPASAGTVRLPGGQNVLRIQFGAPSPLGLLR